MTIPNKEKACFYDWAEWMLHRGKYKQWPHKDMTHRPKCAPKPAPENWLAEYRRRFLISPPATPPATLKSPFAGVGMFTAWNPREALKLRGLIDWVALAYDFGYANSTLVGEMRAAGFDVHIWEAEPRYGQLLVGNAGATGYIAQAEGPGQLNAALNLAVTVPKAIITNLFMPSWDQAQGWFCIGEAYLNTDTNQSPGSVWSNAKNREVPENEITTCLGLYDGSSEVSNGRKIPLSEYLAHMPKSVGWSGYLAEHLTMYPDDLNALQNYKRSDII